MTITFLIFMVGTWNKNQLKAETSQLYYIYLFIFQTFFLRPQYSFKCDGWIIRWRLQNFNRNWYNYNLQLKPYNFITSIYLFFKHFSWGHNTISNATVEFFDDAFRISRGIDTMISLTWSFIWLIVAGIFFTWFHITPKMK